MEKRKCSMCGESKSVDSFRFMKSQSRYNCYCKDCERWYQKHYQREYRRNKVSKRMRRVSAWLQISPLVPEKIC